MNNDINVWNRNLSNNIISLSSISEIVLAFTFTLSLYMLILMFVHKTMILEFSYFREGRCWTLRLLTHSFPMHPFSTLWKHQKTVRFSDIFRGVEKGCTGNEWVNKYMHSIFFLTMLSPNVITCKQFFSYKNCGLFTKT